MTHHFYLDLKSGDGYRSPATPLHVRPMMENNNIVIAVIGGADYEGEDFDTLRLFDSISKAKAYAEELENELGVDYVLVKEKSVEQVAF